MFIAATLAVLVALTLAVARAILGPTVFDRVLAANSIGSLAILLLAVVGFMNGRPDWIDIGLIYGFLNLVTTFAVLKFFRHGDLGFGDAEAGDDALSESAGGASDRGALDMGGALDDGGARPGPPREAGS